MKNVKRLVTLAMALIIPFSTVVYASSSDAAKGEKIYAVTQKALFKVKDKAEFEAQLAAKGMTIEEYKALVEEKITAQAEAKGMTVEEYKVAVKGMTVEEYKAAVAEKFAAKAESLGMTVEELKAQIAEKKKAD